MCLIVVTSIYIQCMTPQLLLISILVFMFIDLFDSLYSLFYIHSYIYVFNFSLLRHRRQTVARKQAAGKFEAHSTTFTKF